MRIDLLADHKNLLPTLQTWFEREWQAYYGSGGPGDAVADLRSRCNRGEFPSALVAIKGTTPLGVVALDIDVSTQLSPSIVGLLVDEKQRGRGIARQLIASAERLARSLGYQELYFSTTVLGSYLSRNGWESIGEVTFANEQEGLIFKKIL